MDKPHQASAERISVAVLLLILTLIVQAYCSPVLAGSIEQINRAVEEYRIKHEQELLQAKRKADAYWAEMMPKILAPAAPSPWLEKERAIFVEAVLQTQPKLLVVPPGVPAGKAGIDISGRITMARELARRIEGEAGEIPDPGFVYRAMGEPRSYSIDDVRQRFAATFPTGFPQWLIVGTATHDKAGRMRVTFSKVPFRKPGSAEVPAAVSDMDGIGIGPDRLPEIQFLARAGEAAQALGYRPANPAEEKITSSARLELPASPGDASTEKETLAGVWLQQLLGVLYTPIEMGRSSRPRERVFERSLAALLGTSQFAPDRSILLARALAYLDRRQAALQVLASAPASPEKNALAAYVNSDLPALTSALAKIQRPAAKLVSEVESMKLRAAYHTVSQGELESRLRDLVASVPEAWRPPVAFNVLALDLWTLPAPTSVKIVLDRDFPVPGYSTEDLVRGKVALGARSFDEKTGVELELSPLVHARRWRASHLSQLCCKNDAASRMQPQPAAYLELLEADADRLAVGKLQFLREIQGSPQDMIKLANLYDDVLFAGGNPGVVHQRLLAAFDMSERTQAEQRVRLGSEAFEIARRLLAWEPGQSGRLADALNARNGYYPYFLAAQGPRPGVARVLPPLGVEDDFPMRAAWARQWALYAMVPPEIALEAQRQACMNTILIFMACAEYLDRLKQNGLEATVDAAIQALVEPRFKGNPPRYELLASRKQELGDVKAAENLLSEAVRMPGASISSFGALGNLLLEQGRFAEAAKTYLGYPGLRSANENRVLLSNYAESAAMALAMHGAAGQARPLFEIASSNADGSQASLISSAMVSLSDHDYGETLSAFRQAYRQYGMPPVAGAIASVLFALRQPDDAWGALRDVIPQAKDFSVYRAAAEGLRAAGSNADAMLQWRVDVLRRSASPGGTVNDLVDTALFQAIALDRDIEGMKSIFKVHGDSILVRMPAAAARQPSVQGTERAVTRPIALFMNAYGTFRKGKHEDAAISWRALVHEYDQTGSAPRAGGDSGGFWAGMPYFAASLAKLGKLSEAANLPARLTPEGRPAGSPKAFPSDERMPSFEKSMIAGIVEAFSGNHEKALQLFRSAQGSLPHPNARIVPPAYAFVELLEFVSSETRNPQYTQLALAFARAYQDYEPWCAWAYAFDAAHSPSGPGRIRAAALALKFNPNSAWLARLDREAVMQAAEWLRKNDPFVIDRPARKEQTL